MNIATELKELKENLRHININDDNYKRISCHAFMHFNKFTW